MPKKITTEDFIKRAKKVHGNIYDYSLVNYERWDKKISIICGVHGVFYQSPNNHLRGKGCIYCKHEKMSKKFSGDLYSFIEKAKHVHGDRYDYSISKYVLSRIKIEIKCPYHGIFNQTPNSHLSGQGCPECGLISAFRDKRNNPPGWTPSTWEKSAKRSKNFDSFKVYIIRCWNDEEEFYKVGRTFNTIRNRFYNRILMPYNYELIKEYIFDTAKEAFDYENKLKRLNKSHKYIPNNSFCGLNECFFKITLEVNFI